MFELGRIKNISENASRIRLFPEYFLKAQKIRCDEYFSIGDLAINEYIKTLRDSLHLVATDLFIRVCSLHEWENEDIIESFHMIETKALQVPTTTEELIEQGKRVRLLTK